MRRTLMAVAVGLAMTGGALADWREAGAAKIAEDTNRVREAFWPNESDLWVMTNDRGFTYDLVADHYCVVLMGQGMPPGEPVTVMIMDYYAALRNEARVLGRADCDR